MSKKRSSKADGSKAKAAHDVQSTPRPLQKSRKRSKMEALNAEGTITTAEDSAKRNPFGGKYTSMFAEDGIPAECGSSQKSIMESDSNLCISDGSQAVSAMEESRDQDHRNAEVMSYHKPPISKKSRTFPPAPVKGAQSKAAALPHKKSPSAVNRIDSVTNSLSDMRMTGLGDQLGRITFLSIFERV